MSKTPICPFIKKECMEHKCMLYTHITMVVDPQSGASRDEWACSLALIPIVILENSRQTRNVSASVDSMRNEVVERQDLLNRAVIAARNASQIKDVEQDRISDQSQPPGETNGR
ncbi:hypothetical protein [Burkholderia anthina]|uniref:hypothetical protein n=1 Tax=Burkholderia anthina TaxID=179879 RepID=UPI000F5D976E|nr:hypothetical protein [Burkholderia anthina]